MMLSSLSKLFDRVEKGDETFTSMLIDTLDVDIHTYVHLDSGSRRFLDAALRAPTRAGFDRALNAYMTRGDGRRPESAAGDWSRWLRDGSFRREVNTGRDNHQEGFGALVSAFQGLRPWAVTEILDRELAMENDPDRPSWDTLPERSGTVLIQMLCEHGVGHRQRFDADSDRDVLAMIQMLQDRFVWTADDWMTPVTHAYHKTPAALALAATVRDESVLRWFVESMKMPLTITSPTGEGWVNTLQDQDSLKGIAWLLDQGFDWDEPLTSTFAFNIEFSQPTLHAWLEAHANADLGDRPESFDRAESWDHHRVYQQRTQELLLRHEAKLIMGNLPPLNRLDRPRL